MTKQELIKELEKFDNDAEIIIAWSCECGNIVVEDLATVNRNGPATQFNTKAMEDRIQKAWIENRNQNGKEI